jgi:hypothetical protein
MKDKRRFRRRALYPPIHRLLARLTQRPSKVCRRRNIQVVLSFFAFAPPNSTSFVELVVPDQL